MTSIEDTSDAVVKSLERPVSNKRPRELRGDYKRLKDAEPDANFIKNYMSFSVLPAIASLILTVLISTANPDLILQLVERLGYETDRVYLVSGIISLANFYLTLSALTNVVTWDINRKQVTSNQEVRTINKKHIDSLISNFSQDKSPSILTKIASNVVKDNRNLLLKLPFRNLEVVPVGTAILYPVVLGMHKAEIKRRGIEL